MLWVDKHRPHSLDKLDYHHELSSKLNAIAQNGDIPHLLLYGPSGAGKKTRALALLRALYGAGVEKVRLEQRTFKTPSNRTVEFTTLGSNYHIEMNPSDTGIYDRLVVQEVIKELAQYQTLDPAAQNSFKVVFLSEADLLTKDAQHGLRRTMEKYVGSCRIIMCVENLGRIIEPLRSRCLCLRVPAPTKDQVCDVMAAVAKKEGLQLPPPFASKVADHSKRNLRRALLTLEACRVQNYPFQDNQEIQMADWERYIQQMMNEMLASQTPRSLLQVRGRLYELLNNCIPADVILKQLSMQLKRKCDDALRVEISHWAAYYDERLRQGQKDIYHLEAFVAKFMAIYKKYLVALFAE